MNAKPRELRPRVGAMLRWCCAGLSGGVLSLAAAPVERFAPHEISLRAAGTYANAYVECSAEATLTEPGGRRTRTLPLFWDGGDTWKLRFAPDTPGTWAWSVRSLDRGLDGQRGTFECSASPRRGGLQPAAGAPRHFAYQNGEHVWFMGDTAWALVSDSDEERHDRAAMERYVRKRAAQGFNVLHFMMLNEAGWPNAGGPPWHDIAAERINPAYFQEADSRIAFTNAQGIVAGIALGWGDKSRNERWPWGRMPNLAARERYARTIAARYGAFDVYFIVAGEWHAEIRARRATEAEVRAEFVQIGSALQAADPHRRMIAIHPMTAHGSTREFNAAAPWMSFADYQQNYTELHARMLASRAVAKPSVNSEYGYYLRDQNGDGTVDKHNSYAVEDIRHATWDIAMAGGYFVTGFGSTYMGGHRHPTTFLPDDPKNAVWEKQIGHVKKFFAGLEYWRLEPHDELVAAAQPRTADRAGRVAVGDRQLATIRPPATTYWCLAEPGRAYLVYARGVEKDGVALRTAGDGKWRVTRFDPRTGQSEALRAAVSEGSVQLTMPDARDWAFVVKAEL